MDWRKTRFYRIWRVGVIRRDKKCVICGETKGRQAHHKNSGSYFPKLRFDVDNGVTLCGFHHILFHTSYMRSFREKCTTYDWNNFNEMIDKMRIHDRQKQLERHYIVDSDGMRVNKDCDCREVFTFTEVYTFALKELSKKEVN